MAMDIRAGGKYPASALSNFAPHPFVFQGIAINSMEGFLQGLKSKNPAMQEYFCTLVGKIAKDKGRGKNWKRTQTLWWKGMPIKRESEEYQKLLDDVYLALFTQNEKARQALLATQDAELTHTLGKTDFHDTVLTRREFTGRLMKIREMLKKQSSTMRSNRP